MYSSWDQFDDKLQPEWNKVLEWSSQANLAINMTNSRVLKIAAKQCISLFVIASGIPLLQVDFLKLLVVTFASDLEWDAHFDSVISEAAKRAFLIPNLQRAGCSTSVLYRLW